MPRIALVTLAVASLSRSLAPAADWPQWRGPDRTDVSSETGLLQTWPEGGPKRLWLYEHAGSGYSGFSVVQGKLFTLGTRDDAEIAIALDAQAGKELWTARLGGILDNGWGDGPRGTPTVDGEHVYALGGQGTLVCLKAADGKEVWRVTMQSLGGATPGWGYTESVLVDGDLAICTPGGPQGTVAALDKTSGALRWQSKELTDGAQYSSPIAAGHNGARQYIQLTMKTLFGLEAATGKLLWKSSWPGSVAVIPTPIHFDGHVYATSGYGAGCKLLKLEAGHKVTDVFVNKEMKNHHGGVVKLGGHFYGYSDGLGWVCQDASTGKVVWRERSKLSKGALSAAGGKLYLVGEDDGTVVLIDASPGGWKENGRFRLDPQTKIRDPDGRIWTHPVVSGGRLYLRDQDLIHCHDVKA